MSKVPAKRLAGFYFFYFCAVGVFTPFLSLYLVDRGYTPAQVGVIWGILGAMRIATPYLWGAIGDRSHRRMFAIKATLLAALLAFAAIFLVSDFASVIALCVAYAFFINGTLTQFEVVVFQHLGERRAEFARIRLWASIGFVVAVIALGRVFDHVSLASFPLWVGGLYFVCWAGAQRIPEPPVHPHAAADGGRLMRVLAERPVQALMAVGLLSWLSAAPFNGFFSLYLDEHGYAKSATGAVWAVAVATEIVLFRFVPQLQRRFGLRNLMLLSLATLAVRWPLQTLCVAHLPLLMAVNALSATSMGISYLSSVALVQEMFPPRLAGRGQAIYTGLSNGIGSSIGSFITGGLWSVWPAELIWYAASAVALIALLIAWRWLHPDTVTRRRAPATVDGVIPETVS